MGKIGGGKLIFMRGNGMRPPPPAFGVPLQRREIWECANIENSPPDKGEYPEGGRGLKH